MESLGERLKAVRESKGWGFDYLSRETNISSRYLEALEKEDFSCFPGEPYVLGFLKNYADYLGIPQEEILSLYRSLKIQEQPVPMEQLLKSPSVFPKVLKIAVIVLAVLALGAGIYYAISFFPRNGISAAPGAVRATVEYTLVTDVLERRFYPGDSIIINEGERSYRLVFASLGNTVNITTPRGPLALDLGQETTITLSDTAFSELRLSAVDFVRNDAVSGALLRFEHTILPHIAETLEESVLSPGREAQVLITSPNPFPFTLRATFQAFCLFQYQILFEPDRAGRNEQFHQRTDEINIQAQNGIRLGISNAQAVRLQVMGGGRTVPFEAGSPGEVVAADLRWLRDEENRFRLMFIRLD